ETISGPTAIDAGAGDDTVRVGHDGTVDELDALLALEGGAGTDALVVDDSADTNDNLGTLTQATLTGLDMVARAGVDRVYTVTPAPLPLEGLNYSDFASLAISLGSGNDRFNVRGTLPATTIDTGGGDDVVYVSDRADLGALAGAAAASGGDLAVLNAAILDGSLDLIDRKSVV